MRGNGGTIIFGWMLMEVKNVYAWAYHHGIWKSPEGDYQDVTTHPHGPSFVGETHFVIDDRFQPSVTDDQPGIDPIYVPTNEHPSIEKLIGFDLAIKAKYREMQAELISTPGVSYEKTTNLFHGPNAVLARQSVVAKYQRELDDLNGLRSTCLPEIERLANQ